MTAGDGDGDGYGDGDGAATSQAQATDQGCPVGYAFSHKGYWGATGRTQEAGLPAGSVEQLAATCAQSCSEKSDTCVAFNVYQTDSSCYTYTALSGITNDNNGLACTKQGAVTDDPTCGSGYSYSHEGYWSNAFALNSPYGKVISAAGTTVAQCAAECNQIGGCVGFNLWQQSDCYVYNAVGNSIGSQGPACIKAP
jgi:hypothetical protein